MMFWLNEMIPANRSNTLPVELYLASPSDCILHSTGSTKLRSGSMKIAQPASPLRISRQPLVRQIADRIRSSIVEGYFQIGEQLSETLLAEQFNVSRTPLREAFRVLESDGIVESLPYKGVRVFTMSPGELDSISEFRRTLEVAALQTIIKRDPQSAAAALSTIVDNMEAAVESNDRLGFSRHDTQFHDALINLSGNPYLVRAYVIVYERLAVLRNLLNRDEGAMVRSVDDHRKIVQLIESGDFDAAETFLSTHIVNGNSYFADTIERIRLGSPEKGGPR